MPREFLICFRLFINELIPIQDRSRADQVAAQVLKHLKLRKSVRHFRTGNDMRCKRNVVRPIDQKVPVMLAT